MPPSSLDLDRLLRETFVRRAERHDVLGSTNDRAKELALQGVDDLPLLVLADQQTAGRGRGSKRWWTGPGGLAFSLLVDLTEFGVVRPRQPMVALAAGIAVVESVSPCLAAQTLGLHWPNDVYAAGRKLAGILIESAAERLHVVGIGINTNNSLRNAPPELRDTAVTLSDLTAGGHDHTEILVRFLRSFESRLCELGPAPDRVGRRANELCLQHGRTLTLDLGDRTIAGVCAGIALDGALLLETAAGLRRFHSGALRASPDHAPGA